MSKKDNGGRKRALACRVFFVVIFFFMPVVACWTSFLVHNYLVSSSSSSILGTLKGEDGYFVSLESNNDFHVMTPMSKDQRNNAVTTAATSTHADGLLALQRVLSSWIERAPALVSRMSSSSSFHSFMIRTDESSILANRTATTMPFIFFHIRKAAGSTLRNAINQSSFENNLTAWIPCYTPGHDCVPFSLPPTDQVYNVYASHVNYMHMVQMLEEINSGSSSSGSVEKSPGLVQQKYSHTLNISLEHGKYATIHHLNDSSIPRFNCMTSLRPTISRVVSCWNFRMVEEKLSNWSIPPSDELTAKDWDKLLPVTYDRYSNGCNNEIVRIFTSRVGETYINSISTTKQERQRVLEQEFEEIAFRLSQCVVIMNHRCEESNLILSHYLPWINQTLDLCHHKENIGNVSESGGRVLQPGAAEVILSQNYLDEMLFQFGEALFEAQLQFAKNASSNV